ncbi:MAG: HAMP domain-containing histidine kinase [Pseudoxanthomonas sp.]|nr:HAMP domain-containing histidine kinase [Thermomonas sp.]MBP8908409.1 HAMP domain-containing histidine kinase [Pseudoxanthomonas sp.]
MSTPMPLRARFTLLATLLGLLVSGLAAATTILMVEEYEYVIATEILRGQAEDYGLRLANGMPADLPKTQRLRGYRIDDPELPPAYSTYPAGVREDTSNHDAHVGVFETSAGRLVFVIDLGDIEALETLLRILVSALVVIGTGLAGGLGWLLSGRALKPLRTLAESVEGLPVEPRRTRLAEGVSADDLGRLAGAIDAYQGRLVEADAHEQAFFADASHELRTPIAVVQGATEVMLDDVGSETDPRRIERLRRLDRGVREMHDLIEMLLVVARRRVPLVEDVDAASFLHEVTGTLHADGASPAVTVSAGGTLRIPRREALLLLRHAIGKLGWPSSGEALSLRLDEQHLELSTRRPDTTPASAGRSDTGGIGALAQRLAAQIGCRMVRESPECIVIELPGSNPLPT